MAWCPLYKAGSTSWLYNLCLLGGYSERELQATQEQLSTLARKAFPELEYPEAEEVREHHQSSSHLFIFVTNRYFL